MTTSTSTKMTQEYLMAFNSHDLDKFVSFYDNNCTVEDIGLARTMHGAQEVKNGWANFFKGFPDAKMEFKNTIQSGDWTASEWVLTGTNTGTIAAAGNMPEMSATNKKISLKGAGFIQMRNNKIIKETDYWNAAAFMMQMGMMPDMMQGSMEGTSSGSTARMTQGSDEARTPG